jgi:hypothetical protein
VTGRYSARYFESEVVRSAGAEEDFVCRIILTEEGFQFGFKAGLRSVQWLEKRQRRGKTRASAKLGQGLAPLAEVARNGPENYGGESGRGRTTCRIKNNWKQSGEGKCALRLSRSKTG